MPIREFLTDKSFEPETIEIMNTAFVGVCADLRLSQQDERAREAVAKRVVELTNGERDPHAIRRAVLASLNEFKGHS